MWSHDALCIFLYKANRHPRELARSLPKTMFMPQAKSRLAMELWCHTVDTLLAKGSSFADALDGANVILHAYQRQNGGEQANDTVLVENDQQASFHEPADEILAECEPGDEIQDEVRQSRVG